MMMIVVFTKVIKNKDNGDGGNYDFALTLVMMNILKMIPIADIDITDVY